MPRRVRISPLDQPMSMDGRKVQKIIRRYNGELTYKCYLEIKEISELPDKTIRRYFGISATKFQTFKNMHEELLGKPQFDFEEEFCEA